MKPERLGRSDGQRRRWLALTGQDIEHNVAADGATDQRLGAGGFHGIKPVAQDRRQDADHLAVAISMATKAAAYPLDCWRKQPVLERRAVAQRARLSRQHRDVMPGIIDRLLTAEPADMFADYLAFLPDDDAIGISMDVVDGGVKCPGSDI